MEQNARSTIAGGRLSPPLPAYVGCALRIEALGARYGGRATGVQALRDVTLDVAAGERLLLLGPNGAGKSTLIRVLAGLMRPSAGSATIGGLQARQARHLVGVVAHATYLYDELSAEENLRLFGALYSVPDTSARANALLDRLGVAHLAEARVGALSRGQQQRVALARALMHDPPVLLLDEPDAGLDVAAFDALLGLVRGGAPRTVILTTHDLSAGVQLGTSAAVLAEGRLVHRQQRLRPEDAAPLAGMLRTLAQGAA